MKKVYNRQHKKILITSDKNKSSNKTKVKILKILKKSNFKHNNLNIVIGGDGFMLKTLKKNKDNSKFFYGINSGNYGFLMNKFSSNKFINNLKKAKLISISPLEMKVKTKTGQLKTSIAINEVSILRQSRQAANSSTITAKIKSVWLSGIKSSWL